MKSVELIYPHVLQYAPKCPTQVAMHHIVQAARRFCEDTRTWRETDEFTTTGASDIIVAPTGATLHEIEYALFDGNKLEPISLTDLDVLAPGWRTRTDGVAQWITQTEFDAVRVVPGVVGTLSLGMFLKPAEDADQLPDFLVDKYAQAIAAGALENILLIPGQPFSNPSLAGVFAARFRDRLGAAGSMNIRGQQRAPVRSRPQFF